MKKHNIISLFSGLVLGLFSSATVASSRPDTVVIPTVEMVSKVMQIEDYQKAIIVTPKTEVLDVLILRHEIKNKNIGTKLVDGKINYVFRVGLYGLSEESNMEVVRELIEGNSYVTKCHSVLKQANEGALLLCQVTVNEKDIFLEMSSFDDLAEEVLLSTKLINPKLSLHTDYEKRIGNLILNGF